MWRYVADSSSRVKPQWVTDIALKNIDLWKLSKYSCRLIQKYKTFRICNNINEVRPHKKHCKTAKLPWRHNVKLFFLVFVFCLFVFLSFVMKRILDFSLFSHLGMFKSSDRVREVTTYRAKVAPGLLDRTRYWVGRHRAWLSWWWASEHSVDHSQKWTPGISQ